MGLNKASRFSLLQAMDLMQQPVADLARLKAIANNVQSRSDDFARDESGKLLFASRFLLSTALLESAALRAKTAITDTTRKRNNGENRLVRQVDRNGLSLSALLHSRHAQPEHDFPTPTDAVKSRLLSALAAPRILTKP